MKKALLSLAVAMLTSVTTIAQLPGCATTVSTFPYNEGFETGFGNWTNIAGDIFDWTRDSGGTTSGSTGPGTGSNASTWYMYIETSSPRVNGDDALLESDCFDFSALTAPTIEFYYHMYGATIGTLELLISTDGVIWTSIWSLSGNQGNAWNTATVDLSAYAGQTVGFRFSGVSGTSFTGDAAIDGLYIYNATPMAFASSTVTQTNTTNVESCAVDAEIIGIEVVTTGSTTPIDLTQLRIRTNGSTAPLADIANIDIYYTGTTGTFSTGTLFGSAAPAGVGTNIFVNGTQTLAPGTNYFWVAYDMAAGSTPGNVIDGLCNNVTVGGSNYTPTVTAPAGNRTIIACTPTPGNVGKTNLTAWFRATDLANGNVTSWTTAYPTGASAITVTEAGAPYPVATETPGGSSSNYNTTIYFDTTNLVANISTNLRALETNATLDLLDNLYAGDEGTFFGTYYFPTYFDNNDHIVCYNEGSGAASFDAIQFRNLGVNGRYAIGHLPTNTANATRNWGENHLPATISQRGNRSGVATMTQYENSLLNLTSSASQATGSVGLRFGYKVGTNTSQYKGFMDEFIFFDKDLSNNEMRRVDSYLAVKYGITLENGAGGTQGDYLSTTSVTIWDADNASGYHNNVIGIGRDDSQELLQKQSHSFYDTTRVYVGTLAATNVTNAGSFSADVSYVMVGDDQGKMCSTVASNAEIPGTCGLYSRLEREWKVTRTNMADDIGMDFTLNACAIPGSVAIADLRFLVDDDGDFSNGGTTCYFNGDGTGITISYANPVITVRGISTTHISNNTTMFVTVASVQQITPLPVELINFSGECKDESIELNWSTLTEDNNDFFAIERSRDGVSYEKLAEIKGAGNSLVLNEYQWVDMEPLPATSFYRLSQTDFDGAKSIFQTISLNCDVKETVLLYPNPFEDQFIMNAGSDGTITIIDLTGKVLSEEQFQAGVSTIGTESLSKGTYIARIILSNGTIEDKKLVKL